MSFSSFYFFREVTYPQYKVCAASVLLMTLTIVVIGALSKIGYFSSIKQGTRLVGRFIDKNFIITEKNQRRFYNDCVTMLPPEFQKCWQTYVRCPLGRPSDYFPSALYIKRIGTLNCNAKTLSQTLASVTNLLLSVLLLIVLSAPTRLLVFYCLCYAYAAVVLILLYRLSYVRAELTHADTLCELERLLDRFSNFSNTLKEKGMCLSAATDEKEQEDVLGTIAVSGAGNVAQ